MQLKTLGIQGATSIDLVSAATAKMATTDLAAVLVKTALTEEEQKQILMARGLSAEEAEAALATAAHSAATATATATTGALTTSTLSLKAAINGLKAAFMSNPLTAIITVALTLLTLIPRIVSAIKDGAEEARQKALEAAQSVKDSFNTATQSISDNIKTLKSLNDEFTKLSKGVDDYGKNISLTSDEYERYTEIVQTIVGISPELITGYNEEGKAIANKNGLLEKSIALMEEEQRLQKEKMVTESNLQTILNGSKEEIKDTWENIENISLPRNLAVSGTIIKDDGTTEPAGVLANNISKYIEDIIGVERDVWDENIEEYVANNIDDIYANLDKILYHSSESYTDNIGTWQGLNEKQIESLKSYIIDIKRQTDELKGISDEFNEYLQLIPESLKQYSKLNTPTKDLLSQWIRESFTIDENTSEADIKEYSDQIKSFTKKLASNSNVQEIIANAMSLKNGSDIQDLTVSEYKKQIGDLMKELEAIDDEELHSFVLSIDIEGNYDEMISRVKNILQSGYDDEIEGMSISDLQIAYTISAEPNSLTFDELQEKIEEVKSNSLIDFATLMQDEEFSDEVDEYIDKITDLQTALENFNNGKLDDEDIVDLIRDFPQLASETDNLGDGIQELINDLTGGEDELGNFSGIYAVFQSQFGKLKTDEDVEQLQNFMDAVLALAGVGDELSKMFDPIDLDAFTEKLDDVTDGLDDIVSSMNTLKEGTALSTSEIVNLISKYPELLKQANLFTDNSIEGQQAMLQSLMDVYEAEYDATIDTKIAELKATNELLESQIELEKKKAEIATEIAANESLAKAEGEQWLTQKIAEFNALQAQDYVSMESGELTVNAAALEAKLNNTAESSVAIDEIWQQSATEISGYSVDAANNAVSATESAKNKIKTKLSSIAKWISNIAKKIKAALSGEDTGSFDDSNAAGDDGSTTINSNRITIGGKTIDEWVQEQQEKSNQRIEAIQGLISTNNNIIDNLENLRGLDLSTILDTGSGSSSSSSSTAENSTETIDYIAMAIDRAEESVEKFKNAVSDTYSTLTSRSSAVKGAINAVTKEIDTQYSAARAYLNAANAIGLSNDLAVKVQNGSIDIAEYDSETADKIQQYQTYYEKYLDALSSAEDLESDLASLYQQNFNNIQTDYENRLSTLEHNATSLNNQIDLIEKQGHTVTASYYNKLINVEKGKLDILYAEKSALTKALNEAVASGRIAKYSEAWYEMMNDINGVDEAIQKCNLNITEFNNNLRDLEWDAFDKGIEKYEKLISETEFLIDMLDANDLVDDAGKLTDSGNATIGLHSYNYEIYLNEAEKYADEIQKLNAQLASHPSNQDLLDRRDELLEKQRDSIKAAQDEKDAIKDLVEDAIDAELDALQDVIDKYEDALDSAKDLYDYQNKVSDATEEISVLQKKIIAYENDTSEEAKAQIQKLKVDLEKAQKELQETEYDQFISDQKKLLDNLYDDYETMLNRRLDNIDNLLSSSTTYLSNISSLLSDITISSSITSGDVPHYAGGGMNYHTGFAWLDGTSTNPEAVLNAEDTKNFIALREVLRSLASASITSASGSYPNVSQFTYAHLMPNYAGRLNELSGRTTSDGVVQQFTISIPIEKVEDYNDFVEQLQKDKKFEKMIRAMTIDQALGGTSLSKNKFVWRNK